MMTTNGGRGRLTKQPMHPIHPRVAVTRASRRDSAELPTLANATRRTKQFNTISNHRGSLDTTRGSSLLTGVELSRRATLGSHQALTDGHGNKANLIKPSKLPLRIIFYSPFRTAATSISNVPANETSSSNGLLRSAAQSTNVNFTTTSTRRGSVTNKRQPCKATTFRNTTSNINSNTNRNTSNINSNISNINSDSGNINTTTFRTDDTTCTNTNSTSNNSDNTTTTFTKKPNKPILKLSQAGSSVSSLSSPLSSSSTSTSTTTARLSPSVAGTNSRVSSTVAGNTSRFKTSQISNLQSTRHHNDHENKHNRVRVVNHRDRVVSHRDRVDHVDRIDHSRAPSQSAPHKTHAHRDRDGPGDHDRDHSQRVPLTTNNINNNNVIQTHSYPATSLPLHYDTLSVEVDKKTCLSNINNYSSNNNIINNNNSSNGNNNNSTTNSPTKDNNTTTNNTTTNSTTTTNNSYTTTTNNYTITTKTPPPHNTTTTTTPSSSSPPSSSSLSFVPPPHRHTPISSSQSRRFLPPKSTVGPTPTHSASPSTSLTSPTMTLIRLQSNLSHNQRLANAPRSEGASVHHTHTTGQGVQNNNSSSSYNNNNNNNNNNNANNNISSYNNNSTNNNNSYNNNLNNNNNNNNIGNNNTNNNNNNSNSNNNSNNSSYNNNNNNNNNYTNNIYNGNNNNNNNDINNTTTTTTTNNNNIISNNTSNTTSNNTANNNISSYNNNNYNNNNNYINNTTNNNNHNNNNNNNNNTSVNSREPTLTSPSNAGLVNMGNSCFMNSVLQCLFHTPPLVDFFCGSSFVADVNTDETNAGRNARALVIAFSQVLRDTCNSKATTTPTLTPVAPRKLKSAFIKFAPHFAGDDQHDSQEFLTYLLDSLHESLNRVRKPPPPTHLKSDNWKHLSADEKAKHALHWFKARDDSMISDIFRGQLRSTIQCHDCGHQSVSFEPFWDLSLTIPGSDKGAIFTGPSNKTTLDACLDEMIQEEQLNGDEAVTCENCENKADCSKTVKIQILPQVLVLHLKRHVYSVKNGCYRQSKNSCNVECPVNGISFARYCTNHREHARYDLYAVSEHAGRSGFGHCTASCRHPSVLKWHRYNDSNVSAVNNTLTRVTGSTPYILFYMRRS